MRVLGGVYITPTRFLWGICDPEVKDHYFRTCPPHCNDSSSFEVLTVSSCYLNKIDAWILGDFCPQAYKYLREEVKTFQGKPIKVSKIIGYTFLICTPVFVSVLTDTSLSPTGTDKSKGNSYKYILAKERIPARGCEPLHTAALHSVILLTAHLQPPAAVSPVQPHCPTDMVSNT